MVSSKAAGARASGDFLAEPAPGILRFIPLGGVGEIGKNLALLEAGPDVVVIDAGLAFPEQETPGVDVLLPDISFLRTRLARLRAVLLTHGHEDHIGALPFYLKELGVPVYGTRMTIGLLRNKLERRGFAGRAVLRETALGEPFQVGGLTVELFHMTHSVPGSCGLAIHTPAGLVVHTGDFKLDQTPVGGLVPDLGRLSHLGSQGVRLLLSDSTNATAAGLTPSELTVRPALRRTLEDSPGRVLVVTFASNLARMRQTLELAETAGRRCCLVGRSMLRNVDTAQELGYLQLRPGLLAAPRELPSIPPNQLCLLATGSQGEPLAALSRIAAGTHPFIRLRDDDTVVLAANPIPGNEATVGRIVNQLVERGVRVLAGSASGVHASGHAAREELRFLLEVVRPQYFIPVHGEPRHLAAHAQLAREVGLASEAIAVMANGAVAEVSKDELRVTGSVSVGAIPVDAEGKGSGSGASPRLPGHQLVVVSVTMDRSLRKLVAGPETVVVGDADPAQRRVIDEGRDKVRQALRHRREFRDAGDVRRGVGKAMEAHLTASGAWQPRVVAVVSLS
ncbi:MAG TPA: ribonuclease J [Candidatus Dormibacteraeota bacterium]|nr:ribonuclease J [Candidatus Dormibacteraeota bacterium]